MVGTGLPRCRAEFATEPSSVLLTESTIIAGLDR
jgi:hypothetical protein